MFISAIARASLHLPGIAAFVDKSFLGRDLLFRSPVVTSCAHCAFSLRCTFTPVRLKKGPPKVLHSRSCVGVLSICPCAFYTSYTLSSYLPMCRIFAVRLRAFAGHACTFREIVLTSRSRLPIPQLHAIDLECFLSLYLPTL